MDGFKEILHIFNESCKALKSYVNSVEIILLSQNEEASTDKNLAILYSMYAAHKISKHEKPFLEYIHDYAINDDKLIWEAGKTKNINKISSEFESFMSELIFFKGDDLVAAPNVAKHIEKQIKQQRLKNASSSLLYESVLISSVIYFENLISSCLKYYINEHPEIISIDNKNISFKELKAYENIDDARKHIIEKEVQLIMYNSFEGWMDYIEKTISLKLDFWKNDKDEITEIFQTRNLFVHNGGVVNDIYLQKVRENEYISGEKIKLSKDYILSATRRLEESGTILLLYLWRKLKKSEKEFRFEVFHYLAYEYMEEEQWAFAEILYKELLANETINDEANSLMTKINYIQCLKWQNKKEDFEYEINTIDFSLYDKKYKIVGYALKDEVDEFIAMLPDIVTSKDISIDNINEWPIFREFRKNEEVAKKIGELIPHNLVVKELIKVNEKSVS